MPSLQEELFPSTPGKFKIERSHAMNRQFHRCFASTSTMFLWALFLIALTASYLSFQSFVDSGSRYLSASWGGIQWEKQVRSSAQIHRSGGMSVLVTGAAGFVGSHVSLALKKRGDGVVGLDNFNHYYDQSLKKARKTLLSNHGIFIVDGDVNDARLVGKLLDVVAFTHVMHLAAQAGVRYAMENPQSYVHSNIAALVTLLEACKAANPQPAIVWASSSSVYGLNEKVPFSELDRTDQPASLYAATKKAGEEITHTYNHIYGLSITGLRFFTVYGPWGRPDMAYFSFTRNILQGKPITIYRGKNRVDLARAPKGRKTDWVMHEYHTALGNGTKPGQKQNTFVLCRLFDKHKKSLKRSKFNKPASAFECCDNNFNASAAENQVAEVTDTEVDLQLVEEVKMVSDLIENPLDCNPLSPLTSLPNNDTPAVSSPTTAKSSLEKAESELALASVSPKMQVEVDSNVSYVPPEPLDWSFLSPLHSQIVFDPFCMSYNYSGYLDDELPFQYGTNEPAAFTSELWGDPMPNYPDEFLHNDPSSQKNLAFDSDTMENMGFIC